MCNWSTGRGNRAEAILEKISETDEIWYNSDLRSALNWIMMGGKKPQHIKAYHRKTAFELLKPKIKIKV